VTAAASGAAHWGVFDPIDTRLHRLVAGWFAPRPAELAGPGELGATLWAGGFAGVLGLLFLSRAPPRLFFVASLAVPATALLATLGGRWLPPTVPFLVAKAYWVLQTLDVRRRADRLLHTERERARALLDAVDTAVLTCGADGRIGFANTAAETLLEMYARDLVGTRLEGVLPRADAAAAAANATSDSDANGDRWLRRYEQLTVSRGQRVVRLPRRDADDVIVQIRERPFEGPLARPDERIVAINDISELGRLHSELERLATRDLVTMLPNRQHLNEQLTKGVAQARRRGEDLALMIVDLDHFKEINDRWGHAAGDQLLYAVGQRLRSSLRGDDVVARLGGDEFVAVIGGLKQRRHAAVVAQKVVDAFADPLEFDGRSARVDLSIGISCLSDRDGDGAALLHRADLAMYQAKRRKTPFSFYAPELELAARRERELRHDLGGAPERDELYLLFQPKVALACGSVIGFEALLRWRRHNGEQVAPEEFIPIAETAGLVESLSRWVVTTAVRTVAGWRRAYDLPLSLAVNISARDLNDPSFLPWLESALGDQAVPASALILELTESSLVQNRDNAVRVMRRIKDLGCRIAIDDFGTGYSSLAYLRDFPIDQLKIDKSFLARVGMSEGDDLIVGAVADLARRLKLEPVAEGVETSAQLRFLRRLQVEKAQGFLFSRPLTAEAAARLLAEGARIGGPAKTSPAPGDAASPGNGDRGRDPTGPPSGGGP